MICPLSIIEHEPHSMFAFSHQACRTLLILFIAHSGVQDKWRLGIDEFSNFKLIRVHHKKDHVKISQLSSLMVCYKFGCNHVDGFQKAEKLETLYGVG